MVDSVRVVAPGRDHHYCYDGNSRLSSIRTGSCSGTEVTSLGYDVQGNLASKAGVAYTFDHGNRLRAVSSPASVYLYDGHGRRVRDASPDSRYSVYSQSGQLVFDYNKRDITYNWYVHLNGSLVATRTRNYDTGVEHTRYQHTDALGSPVVVTNESRTVVKRNEYEPYGKLVGAAMEDGPGYTGHMADAATGLVYMQQRYYDPSIDGRFPSVDPVTPISAGGAFNRYWYANANPYMFKDPDGRRSMSDHPGIQGSRILSTGPIVSEKSWGQRVAAADRHIDRVKANLQTKQGGNRFDTVDDAARYFGKSFANMSQYLRIEFGGYANPGTNAIVNLDRSTNPDKTGTGSRIHILQGPIGGAAFHTHPDLAHPSPGFSPDDIQLAKVGNADYEYVFYGDSVGVARKLDVRATSQVGWLSIFHNQDAYAPIFK